jgi:hypothetical protein
MIYKQNLFYLLVLLKSPASSGTHPIVPVPSYYHQPILPQAVHVPTHVYKYQTRGYMWVTGPRRQLHSLHARYSRPSENYADSWDRVPVTNIE